MFRGVKFEEVGFLPMLEGVLKKKLVTRSELAREEEDARANLFDSIENEVRHAFVQWFLEDIKSSPVNYKIIYGRMGEKEKLKNDLLNVCKGVCSLPEGLKESLPVFAARISSDPHYFDNSSEAGKLLLKALSFKDGCLYPETAEERAELLYNNGIMVDELSNTVLVYGLAENSGSLEGHLLEGAVMSCQPLVLSLYNLSSIKSLKSFSGFTIVVENPSIMAALIRELPHVSCICTSGMPNIAGLITLKLLHGPGECIYYSGDFDPEGILIADKLWRRFKDIRFLCFDEECYIKSLSHNIIEGKRLKKLEKIENAELQKLAGCIEERAFSGYQESIIKDIIETVKNIKTA